MQELPHHYTVRADAAADGSVDLSAERLDHLQSSSPAEFGGPGDRWSPETLLTAAVAGCFILTFRAVARASTLPWTSLQCEVVGTLDRVDKATQFTEFILHAHLVVPPGTNPDLARRALEKAERNCLVSNSLNAAIHLQPEVEMGLQPAHV